MNSSWPLDRSWHSFKPTYSVSKKLAESWVCVKGLLTLVDPSAVLLTESVSPELNIVF